MSSLASTTLSSVFPTALVGNIGAVSANPQGSYSMAAPFTLADTFESFSNASSQTEVKLSLWQTIAYQKDFQSMKRRLATLPPCSTETQETQYAMLRHLYRALDDTGRQQLKRLLNQEVLSKVSPEDGHTALYQLYQRLNTPCFSGFDNFKLLGEMLSLLDRPYTLTQKPGPLLPAFTQSMLEVEAHPVAFGRLRKTVYVQRLHTRNDLNIHGSFDCTASAVMFGMLDQQPAETLRQLNGLVSPQRSFQKHVRLDDLAPGNSQKALSVLQQQHVPYQPVGTDQVIIRVTAPEEVVIRALNDAERGPDKNQKFRSPLQTLYQMTMVELADPNGYDEADGKMVAPDGSDPGPGLPGDLIDVMSSLIEGHGGTQSVTTQVMDAKPDDVEGKPYLMGYTLPFDYTTKLLVKAIESGAMPMVGIVYLDAEAGYLGGHYIRLTSSYVDPQSRERYFVAADSDDNIPVAVKIQARKLIPMINRIHLPSSLAQATNAKIDSLATQHQLFMPDAADSENYRMLPIAHIV